MSEDTSKEEVKSDERSLREVLHSLDDRLRLQVSYKFIFLRGLLYGLGTVIGATILIAVISWLLVVLGLDWIIEFVQLNR